MILVTLGTQKENFKRLLDYIENSKISEKIVVQGGYNKYNSKKMEIFDFIDIEEMDKLISKADLVITHGGTGSIVSALKKGKKIIACPRLSKFGEHVDDHQCEIVDIFAEEGYILKLDEKDSLDAVYALAKKFKPKKFISNKENFIELLRKEISL